MPTSNVKSQLLKNGWVQLQWKKNPTDEELLNLAEGLSEEVGDRKKRLLHWEFGPVMKMKLKPRAQNYLFSAQAVPFHWDGAFFKEPQFLLFYCDESQGSGGETTFYKTNAIYQSLSHSDKKLAQNIEIIYETEKVAHYGGKIQIPLVQKHPLTGEHILRLAQSVSSSLNPVQRTILSDPTNLVEKLEKILLKNEIVHQWKKGDLVIVDNFSMVHGRKALRANKNRSFRRIQIL